MIAAARHCYALPVAADIVAGPGSQSLLQLLPALWPDRSVAVLGPTYEEHAQLWRAAGHRVTTITSLSETGNADTVILVNPNNPDGRTVNPQYLVELAQSLPKPHGVLIVDEAFADLDPACSVSPHLTDAPILSIRSLDRKSTRLNSSHSQQSRMPSSA